MYEVFAYRPYKDIPLVTSLPSNPSNGDMCVLTDSLSAPTYSWMLKYVSAKASNKWQFVGGSPLTASVTAQENTSATSYTALGTAGPSIAIPVAGDYIVKVTARTYMVAGCQLAIMSYDIGATGAVDADGAASVWAVATTGYTMERTRDKPGLTAVTLTAKYKTANAGADFSHRRLELTPVAIGG